jgi:F-type H+-transporting ATPase subunit delta
MSFAIRSARLLASRGMRAMQSRSYSDEMSFTLAAANQVFYDSQSVRQVDVPSMSGAFGILPKHVPTIGKFTTST